MRDGDRLPGSEIKVSGVGGYKNVQAVPVSELADHATQRTDPDRVHEVRQHVKQHGMEPLILQYHPKSGEAYLGEGNHRLKAAQAEGMSHVPVRVTRNVYGLSGEGAPTKSEHPAQSSGSHVPADIKPSDIGFGSHQSKEARMDRRLAYGETVAPSKVDTLRPSICPVCSDDSFNGDKCRVCSFFLPPAFLQDPDLTKARQMDLRQDQKPGFDEGGNAAFGDASDIGQVSDQQGDGTVDPSELEDGEQQPYGGREFDNSGVVDVDVRAGDVGTNPQLKPGEPGLVGPEELPAEAEDRQGQPFTQGPNMPGGPQEPEGPSGPLQDEDLEDQLSQEPLDEEEPDAQPVTCDSCGFSTQSEPAITSSEPGVGSDGVAPGDLCPKCQQGQLR